MNNSFIVFDGPDGSGKSTLSRALAESLRQMGRNVLLTYEPTNTSAASQAVRRYLSGEYHVDPRVLSDLFTKDREEHVASVILPQLSQNGVVICDRYKYSALVYQRLQGVDPDYLVRCNAAFPVPDLVFVLIPGSVDVLMDRIAQLGEAETVFEERSFLSQTISMYKQLPAFFPNERFAFLDAELPMKQNLSLVETYILKQD